MRKLSRKFPVSFTIIAFSMPALYVFFQMNYPENFDSVKFVGKLVAAVFFTGVVWAVYGLMYVLAQKTVKKENQEVKEPIQKEKQKVMVKYTCPQCKTELEVELMAVERIVQCKECKTKINMLPPPPPPPRKKLSLKEKQKLCLWIGIAVIVLMGLFPPVTCRGYRLIHRGRPSLGQVPYSYTGYDFIFKGNAVNFGTLITQWVIVSVITASLIYTFKDKKSRDE